MNCWHCNSEVIWGGDHDYEDYGMEGEGIVSNLSCSKCDADYLIYLPIPEENITEKQRGLNCPIKENNMELNLPYDSATENCILGTIIENAREYINVGKFIIPFVICICWTNCATTLNYFRYSIIATDKIL